MEVPRQKRKYEKKQKVLPLSSGAPHHPVVFNAKDLNQYDFPSSDDEPFPQVQDQLVRHALIHRCRHATHHKHSISSQNPIKVILTRSVQLYFDFKTHLYSFSIVKYIATMCVLRASTITADY